MKQKAQEKGIASDDKALMRDLIRRMKAKAEETRNQLKMPPL